MWSQIQKNEFSSWVHYPEKYKFFSFHFTLNKDMRYSIRRTYTATQLASELGGVYIVIFRLFGIIVAIFSRLRMYSLLTNRLFYLPKTKSKSNQSLFKKNEFDEDILNFPKFIDLEYLRFVLCYCCCKAKNDRFIKFRRLVQQGSDEIKADLDIVRVVRRLRSYGIALYYLTNKQQRILISRMAGYKPLRENASKEEQELISWENIHNQNFKDRLQYHFFRRFSDILVKFEETNQL